jgi:hypothetical protein
MVETNQQQVPNPTRSQNYQTPNQLQEAVQGMASLTKLLLEISNYLNTLRMEFRGEALYQYEDGRVEWIQVSKPTFVRMNFKTNMPIKKEVKMPWGEKKEIYVPNDEAIDEIISMLKFMGINNINPIGFNQPDNYQDDLKEFECKLAAVLCLKQKEWGLDKELLPMIMTKIKTIVQDVRSMSVNGNTLKSLISTVQRVESVVEGDQYKNKLKIQNPYGK